MSDKESTSAAFLVNKTDNVVTLLQDAKSGSTVKIFGDIDSESKSPEILITENISVGHKAAYRDISVGDEIIKYGVVIGRAIKSIPKGAWVHLHCIHSIYDERSSHLDVVTGAPKDISYE